MRKAQSITSLPRSADDARRTRMIQYSITMGIRIVCIVACFFTPGWWLLIPALGAVVLPYVAVVLANVGTGERTDTLTRPQSSITGGQTESTSKHPGESQ